MKNIVVFISCMVVSIFAQAENGKKFQVPQNLVTDTVPFEDIALEDSVIEYIIKTKTPPKQDKVQYFSSVTKYGFKNLFKNYSYTSNMPYSQQVNPNAESFMQSYLRKQGGELRKMKGWAQPYFNLIDNILVQYGLPKELKYVAVIESHLNVNTVSWVGAVGPWQFMPATAREYGLVISGGYDERKDYNKSTHAAARYLLKSYRVYHDWLLAIASYNGGMGNVNRAIRKSGSKNFWVLQHYLPKESREYVKKFIATHYIMEGGGGVTTNGTTPANETVGVYHTGGSIPVNNTSGGTAVNPYAGKPNFTEEEMEGLETQSITGKFNSLIIAKNLSMEITKFNYYNPGFDSRMMELGNYDLRLPADKMQLFLANKYQILNECVQVLLGETDISASPAVHAKPVKAKTSKKKKVKSL